MSDNRDSTNPYAAPAIEADSLVMRRRSFQIGREEIHTIQVETSIWTGLTTRAMDAAGKTTANHRGSCRFQVGQRETHQVEIELDASHRVNVLVDGKRFEANLFPRMRVTVMIMVAAFVLVLMIMALVIAYILASKLP